MNYQSKFEVIVVGGGHSGAEAAYASAAMGASTLLLTQQIDTIGQMSCNPAIGGLGKSQLVCEIDALGGIMGIAADAAGIQFRVLNASKGPAVRATRVQADRAEYRKVIQEILGKKEGLAIFQQEAADVIIENGTAIGVVTKSGMSFYAKSIIFTVGTFLGGMIHIGDKRFAAGRAGDAASEILANKFRNLEFPVGRLKTGTPPRIDSKSIDYSSLEEQHGDTPLPHFSVWGESSSRLKQVPCHITHTNEKTIAIIEKNMHYSAVYSGAISGSGPRYCPSIEDKVRRFSHRNNHQVFIEPEGLNTCEVYPNGISTSLPFEVQCEFVRTIVGFENAHIMRPGYAIEYDFFDPRGLRPWLETKKVKSLFFAGQINGTTGYEEAAAQGIVAGINAVLSARGQEPWYPRRDQAYIGVMLDDLVTRGTLEPYRMFTSRSEYRLSLRQDNSDQRMTPMGYKLGLISDARWGQFQAKQKHIETLEGFLKQKHVAGSSLAKHDILKKSKSGVFPDSISLWQLLKRPEINFNDIVPFIDSHPSAAVSSDVEILAKYEGYIVRQSQEVVKNSQAENTKIPKDFDYSKVASLSTEAREVLTKVLPENIAQAARIPGITPATISLLLVFLKSHAHV